MWRLDGAVWKTKAMIGTFPGKLSFADGDEVDVDLEIAAGQLKLVTGISEIGSWPLDLCSLAPDAADAFHLTVDGDRVRFSPDHPDAFHAFVTQLDSDGGHAGANGNGARQAGRGASSEPVTPDPPGEVASDEDIALTLEALFASAFSEDGEAPVHTEAAPGDQVPAAPQPPAVSPPAPAFEGSLEDEYPAIDAGDWDSGQVEVDEWSPEVAAAALQAELASARVDDVVEEAPAADPFDEGSLDQDGLDRDQLDHAAVDRPDDRTSVEVPGAEQESDAWDDPEEWGRVHPPETATPGSPTDDAPVAHWRDYDPFDADDEASHEPAPGAEAEEADPPRDAWRGEVVRDVGIDEPDHFTTPPPGYGDAAFVSTGDGLYGDDPLGDPGRDPLDDPWGGATTDDFSADPADDDVHVDETRPTVDAGDPDRGWFRSSATERLASVADAIKERSASDDESSYSVADEVLASQQQLRSSGRHSDAGRIVRKVGIPLLIVVILGGLAFLTPRVVGLIADRLDAAQGDVEVDAGEVPEDQGTPPVTTADSAPAETPPETAPVETTPTTPSTTVPDTTPTTEGRSLIFDVPASEFPIVWNDLATSISPRFEIPSDPGDDLFSFGLTDYVGMEGRVGPDGTVDGFSVIVDPRGESDDDELGIQALGVAIGVVDPTTNGADRRGILMDLGLDVVDPDLAGIDGQLTRNGVAYRLVYDEETFLLRFSLAKAQPGAAVDQPADADEEPAGD